MTELGLFLASLSALLTAGANLMLRGGLVRGGGFRLWPGTFISDLLRLGCQPLFVGGFILYGAAALVWFRVISTENLTTSYPVLVGLTFVLVTVGGTFLFHESISWQKVLGLLMILVGVLVVSRV